MLQSAPIIQVLRLHILVQGPGNCLKGREHTGCALMHVSTETTRLIRHYWPKCQEFDGCTEPGIHQCKAGRLVCCKHAYRFGWLHTLHAYDMWLRWVPEHVRPNRCLCELQPEAVARGVGSIISCRSDRFYRPWKISLGRVLPTYPINDIEFTIRLATEYMRCDAIYVWFSFIQFAMPMDDIDEPWDYGTDDRIDGLFGWERYAVIMHLIVPLKRYMIACHQKKGDQCEPYDELKDRIAMDAYFEAKSFNSQVVRGWQ